MDSLSSKTTSNQHQMVLSRLSYLSAHSFVQMENVKRGASGSIDVYIFTSGGAAGIFPYVQVLDLPYLMADDRVAEHVLAGDFTRLATWLWKTQHGTRSV